MIRFYFNLIVSIAACGLATQTARADFTQDVDLSPLESLAIYTEGRVKSFDSFAREAMQYVSGSRTIRDQSATFTYFDIMLRPEAYFETDVVYVKKKQIRAQIASVIRESILNGKSNVLSGEQAPPDQLTDQIETRLNRFTETGLISPVMLNDGRVQELLGRISQDVLRGAKPVQEIETALAVMNPQSLRGNLRFVPPSSGNVNDRWVTLDEMFAPHANLNVDQNLRTKLLDAWQLFNSAWIEQKASGVNHAATQLADLLPQVNSALYPDQNRLDWESWYFRMHNLTWIWILYGFAIAPLLLSVVFRWNGARWLGLLLFVAAFSLHTFAVMLRWYVSQRWPNANMFEAVTTSAWFGGCLALILEFVLRHRFVRNLFALGSAVASMTALMAVYFLPLDLSPHINNKMPVLHDVWLYIHTNVVIFSYCLIFIAAVSAVGYLLYRLFALVRGINAKTEYARVGGAGTLILSQSNGNGRTSLGQVFDGTTMIIMELAFVLLWTGIVMGAIWADHSWGRPWGWDPKEVFALNTFIIFLLLIHVRLKVRDKGLWTAILAVIGAAVMLFNWIIINFAITGLHSYA